MFPKTLLDNDRFSSTLVIGGIDSSHVERVCLLSKLRSEQHIEVELKMNGLDLTIAESKYHYLYYRRWFGKIGGGGYFKRLFERIGDMLKKNSWD